MDTEYLAAGVKLAHKLATGDYIKLGGEDVYKVMENHRTDSDTTKIIAVGDSSGRWAVAYLPYGAEIICHQHVPK